MNDVDVPLLGVVIVLHSVLQPLIIWELAKIYIAVMCCVYFLFLSVCSSWGGGGSDEYGSGHFNFSIPFPVLLRRVSIKFPHLKIFPSLSPPDFIAIFCIWQIEFVSFDSGCQLDEYLAPRACLSPSNCSISVQTCSCLVPSSVCVSTLLTVRLLAFCV